MFSYTGRLLDAGFDHLGHGLWFSAKEKKRLPGEVTSLDNRWAGVFREEVAAGGLEPPTKGL